MKAHPEQSIEKWGWGSIGVNIVLSLINLTISLASGSMAVAAEMIHNIVDLTGSVTVLAGLKISRHSSKNFPYGLYKVENLVALGLSGFIFFTAFEIIDRVFSGSLHYTTVRFWMLGGVILSGIIPLIFSQFQMKAGKQSNSPSLIADASEFRMHVLTSGIVLLALVGDYIHLHLDRWAALLVVIFILKTGWELLRDGLKVLLDASMDPSTLARAREIIIDDPAVASVTSLTGRNSGRFRFLEADITIRLNDLKKVQAVRNRLEQMIRKKIPNIERVLIRCEPFLPVKTQRHYAIPLNPSKNRISEHFGEAPYFLFINLETTENKITKETIIANPFRNELKAKGIRVAEWLVFLGVDTVLTEKNLEGKGPGYVFIDAGIEILKINNTGLDQIIANINEQTYQKAALHE